MGAVPGTCTLTPTTGPLVNLTATNGVPAFATHMIGVNGAPWPNYQCARINKYYNYPGQSLTIGINNVAGGPLNDPTFGAFLASAATFDLEVTDNSKLKAELLVNGSVVGTYALWADDNKTPTTVPAGTAYCRLASTWSRDTYGKKDNCTWSISGGPNFDSIRLTAVAGSFSVEGGGDWGADAATHRTTISLVSFFDGTTVCGDAITVVGQGSDSIDGTVDYGVAFGVIEKIVTGERRFLIEALALAVAKALIARYPQIRRAEITVRKPNAPVAGVLDHVEVTVVWPG